MGCPNRIMSEVKKVIIGKDEVIRKVMITILAKGHILIEDIPGVGKTTLALAFSKAMSLKHNRMQFTPDVMPSDVTGFSIYNKEKNQFEYREGAVMCNLFLADEINRTSSKTQSALLESMEEGKVTVDGVTRVLPVPFTVIATQNPIGSVGTQMLPESQLDRFMMKITMGYPSLENEVSMLKSKHKGNPMLQLNPIVSMEELIQMQAEVEQIFVHDNIYEYIACLVKETREHEFVQLGVSPRGSIAIKRASQAAAYLNGRDFVSPDDVREILADTIGHRIVVTSKARVNRISAEDIVNEIMKSVVAKKG